MGSLYRSRHKLIFALKNGTAPYNNTFGLGQGGRYRTNVCEYRGANSGGAARLCLSDHGLGPSSYAEIACGVHIPVRCIGCSARPIRSPTGSMSHRFSLPYRAPGCEDSCCA